MEIEFRRHSIKDGPVPAMIGPMGCALAREVGRRQLRGWGFTAFYVSTYWRTHQTLAAFAEGAGVFVLKLMPEFLPLYVAWPEVKALWGACAAAEKRGRISSRRRSRTTRCSSVAPRRSSPVCTKNGD